MATMTELIDNTVRTKFHDLLNEQIANEFSAPQQYIAVAVYYDNIDMPQLARHFYRQAVEERNHAMMILQYFLDRDMSIDLPGIEAPRSEFDSSCSGSSRSRSRRSPP